MTEEPHGDELDVSLQTNFQKANQSQKASKSSPLLAQIKQILTAYWGVEESRLFVYKLERALLIVEIVPS